jgi:cobalt-zinc-cadmium efflux system membrane fusion protein
VPEEVCAQCDTKLVSEFKVKGDWCEEHNRPESQCFVCHPEKEAEFAELYEAKYGELPPKVSVEASDKHGDHEHHDHT